MERPRLMDLELRGTARMVRRVAFYALAASGVVALIGYLLPAHTVGQLELHSNFADGGVLPLFFMAAATAVTAWASRRRFGAGMISAVVAGTAASIELVRTAFAHPLFPVHSIYGDYVHLGGLVSMFGFAMLLFIIEPVLYDAERKRQERPEVKLPRAQVVSNS
ncbi:MAG TPA: hypothetical protein VL326_23510 [Kofleriaceae bacterium]|nr:hypothetical protein [Kofleriaceae bacterium]